MSRKIPKVDRKNFESLSNAFRDGNVCIMDVQRVADGKSVTAVCAMQWDKDENVTLIPFAIMVEGNPFELFRPPNNKGDGYCE